MRTCVACGETATCAYSDPHDSAWVALCVPCSRARFEAWLLRQRLLDEPFPVAKNEFTIPYTRHKKLIQAEREKYAQALQRQLQGLHD